MGFPSLVARSVCHRHGGFEPPFDVEQHPTLVGVVSDRLHEQIMANAVKEGPDIEIEHPVLAPTTLASHGQRTMGASPRPHTLQSHLVAVPAVPGRRRLRLRHHRHRHTAQVLPAVLHRHRDPARVLRRGHGPPHRRLDHPTGVWTTQAARNLLLRYGHQLADAQALVRDRASQFIDAFDEIFRTEGCKVLTTPVSTPVANAFAERWIGTLRRELLNRTIIWNRRQLHRSLRTTPPASGPPHRRLDHPSRPPAAPLRPPTRRRPGARARPRQPFIDAFDEIFRTEGCKVLTTPVSTPVANAFAERWIGTLRRELLNRTIHVANSRGSSSTTSITTTRTGPTVPRSATTRRHPPRPARQTPPSRENGPLWRTHQRVPKCRLTSHDTVFGTHRKHLPSQWVRPRTGACDPTAEHGRSADDACAPTQYDLGSPRTLWDT